MKRLFAVAALALIGAFYSKPVSAAEADPHCWYEAWGQVAGTADWDCLGSECPGGWCCKICVHLD
jgi:hypothetical protein